MENSSLPEIIKRAGGRRAIARALGMTEQAVGQWKQVPPRWVVDVAAMAGMSPTEIRPDVFRDPLPQVMQSIGITA
ncbi:helix-turn-helix domain-containing protein [Komagataeibacter xylinus]|uniref:Helix-turn-helix domain-containing protein n=2 Tax=Komagataeibacter xylinus TaxID=28448 RepID=A0A857FSJ2_KOMXY|nr:helix-turn-helix domain-containing protein [Komagataeibacter xylinus]